MTRYHNQVIELDNKKISGQFVGILSTVTKVVTVFKNDKKIQYFKLYHCLLV